VQFHRTWVRPSNGTLFVVGDTTLAEILPMLEEQFGDWPEDPGSVPAKNLAEVSLQPTGRVIIIDKPGAPQSMILAGHLAPPTGVAENLAIETMNDILGGQFTARANMNLREDKGWAYGAYTLLPNARGQRAWIVYAPVQTDRTADSVRELRREFDEYLEQRPATPEELQKSVRNAVNSLPGQFETSESVMNSLTSNQRFGRADDYVPGLPARYAQLYLEQVQGSAEQVLAPDRLTWLIVGDRAKIEAELKTLNLGPVSAMDADGKPVE
jgi:zinc protease